MSTRSMRQLRPRDSWLARRTRVAALVASGAVIALIAATISSDTSRLPAVPTSTLPATTTQTASPAQLGLVPKPVSVELRDQAPFVLRQGSRILAGGPGAQAPAARLAEVLRPSTGFTLPVTQVDPAAADRSQAGTEPGHIVIAVAAGLAPAGHAAEGYTLAVDASEIRIDADTPNGGLDGVETLRQLFSQWVESDTVVERTWTVPAVAITDYPRFAYRGMMLDVARSFYPVDEVKRYIDDAAQFKINYLHLHLTDDQGWRIAIDSPTPEQNPSHIAYDRLTQVSGATAMTYDPTGEIRATELGVTGFYTKADYLEIVRYAAANGMVVVPEIDLPSHTNGALHAIPQLNTAGARPTPAAADATVPANGTPAVGYSSLDPHSRVTYEFVDHVLREIAQLTPGPYLHIGGDEAYATSRDDYLTMVNRFAASVNGLGKTVVGWNEYAGAALPQGNSVVQYWYGNWAPTVAAVRDRRAKVVLSPVSRAYLSQRQDPRQPNGRTWACGGGTCPLANYYSWDPGSYITGIRESDVLGVESALWGEFIRRIDQAEYFTYPRLAALAEVGWTPQAMRTFPDFTSRVAVAGGRMVVQGMNFFPSAEVPWQVSVRGGGATTTTVGHRSDATWTVTAPGETGNDLVATVQWSDGVTEWVPLMTTREPVMASMWLGGPLAARSRRTFPEPGTVTGRLSVARPGQPPAVGDVTVRVIA